MDLPWPHQSRAQPEKTDFATALAAATVSLTQQGSLTYRNSTSATRDASFLSMTGMSNYTQQISGSNYNLTS